MRRGSDYVPEKKPASVEIVLANGHSLKGRLWVTTSKSLPDTLNAAQSFLEFTPYGEEGTRYLAKAQITSVEAIDVPKSVPLYERRGVLDADDPNHILGVTPGAPWHTVREAYLRLAKTYHPDRFSGVELPTEVSEYLGAKARRVNAAYAALEDSLKRAANSAAKETDCAAT